MLIVWLQRYEEIFKYTNYPQKINQEKTLAYVLRFAFHVAKLKFICSIVVVMLH